MSKPNVLWVGDAGCPSGFALATHKIVDVLKESCEVTILGINYRGDPPNPRDGVTMYSAHAGGDFMGVGRLIWMCDVVKPDLIILQNDVRNVPAYLRKLAQFPQYADIPVIAAMAVDGKNTACINYAPGTPTTGLNVTKQELKGLSLGVFWTEFGLEEVRNSGYDGPAVVIPLGVDTKLYHPMDKKEARLSRGLPAQLDEAFIVGNVNRNQPRKRWDLTIQYFAEWITSYKLQDAWLFLHTAPTGDTGFEVRALAQYYGILPRLILMEPPVFYGVHEDVLRQTYNCFDVQMSTTQGEGFGLTHFEGMACKVPQIVPDWSALGELLKGAAWMVPCPTTAADLFGSVIGGVPDKDDFVRALHRMYSDTSARETNAQAAYERAHERRFHWDEIGKAWKGIVDRVLAGDQFEDTPAVLEEETA